MFLWVISLIDFVLAVVGHAVLILLFHCYDGRGLERCVLGMIVVHVSMYLLFMHYWYVLNHFLMIGGLFMLVLIIRVRVGVVEPWQHPTLMIVYRFNIMLVIKPMVKLWVNLMIDACITALLLMVLSRLVVAMGDDWVKNLVLVNGRTLMLVVLLHDIGGRPRMLPFVDDLLMSCRLPDHLFTVGDLGCLVMYWLVNDIIDLLPKVWLLVFMMTKVI